MWRRIEDYREKHKMIGKGDRILLGLSGGPDSVLLARYLLTLRERQEISLVAVHVNHQLRGPESFRDEDFVRAFCDSRQIPCHICREDVGAFARQKRCSLEEAGRILRYRCFSDLADKTGCHKIALAHHGDDLAETMIFRMVRGTGPEGMPGMLPVNGRVIRPLLFLGKEEIIRMLAELSQDYVEDSSNDETGYSRNYIRRHIMPGLREVNPRAVGHMVSLSGQMHEQNEFVRAHFDRIYETERIPAPEGVRLPLSYLRGCDSFSQKEVIRRMLFDAGGRRRNLTAIHVTLVQELISRLPGKKLDLPYGIRAAVEEDHLYLRRGDAGVRPPGAASDGQTDGCSLSVDKDALEAGGRVILPAGEGTEYQFELVAPDSPDHQKNDCAVYFNYDRIKNKLFLRTRRQGDYFVMDHLGRKKLLRRYFIDQKIAAEKRDKVLLLAEGSHILWISGGRTSEAYKVTDRTSRVLRVLCVKKDGGNQRYE